MASVESQDGTLVITSDDMDIDELYTYIDLDMYISPDKVQITPEDGVTVEYGADGTSSGNATNTASETESHTASLLSCVTTEKKPAVTLLGDDFPTEAELPAGYVPLGINISGHFSLDYSGVTGRVSAAATLESIVVNIKFSVKDRCFYMDTGLTSGTTFDIEVGGKGNLGTKRKLLAGVKYPLGIPLLHGENNLIFAITADGVILGGITDSVRQYTGFNLTWDLSKGNRGCQIRNTSTEPKNNTDLKLMDIGGIVRGGFEFEQGVGMLGVANVLMSSFLGVEIKATEEDVYGEDTGSRPDFIHDCDICLDIEAGGVLEFDLLGRLGFMGSPLEIRGSLATIKAEPFHFYLSLKRGDDTTPEFGKYTCPHKRFRTDITVLNEGDKVKNAKIEANSSDSRSFEAVTDENGFVEMYLPVGDNAVTASAQGAKGTANVPIVDSLVSVTINLTDDRQIFITWRYLNADGTWMNQNAFPYITDTLLRLYPEAEVYSAAEWGAYTGGWGENNHITTPLEEPYGVSPGDIIINVFSNGLGTKSYREYGETYTVSDKAPWSLNVFVGMVMLPTEEEVEMGISSDEPYVVWFGDHMLDMGYALDDVYEEVATSTPPYHRQLWVYALVTEVSTHVMERQWLGFAIDEDFRMTQMGEWGEWSEWEGTLWQGSITHRDFLNSAEIYSQTMFERDLSTVCKTVEMLWDSNLEEDPSGDIVVSETP